MGKRLDYYISLNSPWTYLGGARLATIAQQHNLAVQVMPVDYASIFAATGGLPLPKRAPERQAYRLRELDRWREYLGLPLNLQPRYFPADETLAAQLVLAADLGADTLALANAIGRAVWAEERNIADPETLAAIVTVMGLDAQQALEAARQPEIAERRAALTQQAIQAGVFGAPSYVLDGEIFWGQDRLDFLERALILHD